jgi:hypothetical protein
MTLLLLFNQPPLHEDLLNSAHQFIEQSHYGVAVVLAQTAFEVFTAQVRSQLIQKRQLTAMGDWIAKGPRRVDAQIDFYVAVTRDQIQQDGALWPQYRAHAEQRHAVVHDQTHETGRGAAGLSLRLDAWWEPAYQTCWRC